MRTTAKGFHRHGAPNTVRHAVVGTRSVHPDPDAMLRNPLVGAIEDRTPAATVDSRFGQVPVRADPGGSLAADTVGLTVS